jgi:3-hydroxy-9,10-secoandrosta-1,3,5(10)-triene-9,17-dione monooxygenase
MPDETRPPVPLMPSTTTDRAAEAASFLAAIDALLPELRSRAAEVEQRGMVPDDIIRSLTAAGVFRALQPRQWGGRELDFAAYYEGMIRLASACTSTGWVASVVGVHPWHAALFASEAQQELWGDNPDAMMSTSLAPVGQVERTAGGYRLTGRWPFSSGVDHCGWVVLGGTAPDGAGGGIYHTFLVPRRDYMIDQESWKVTGLAGTGSKTVILSDVFVPKYRTHSIVDNYNGTDPGLAINDRPYYRLPWRLVFGYCIAAPAAGAAVGALEAFIAGNRDRHSAHGAQPVARNPALHRPLARALAIIGMVRQRMAATWTELQGRAFAGQPIPYEQRTRAFYEATMVHDACSHAIYELMGVNGGRTMNADTALQRHFRDMLTMRNHPAANIEMSSGLYAQAVLGVPPPPFDPSQRFFL